MPINVPDVAISAAKRLLRSFWMRCFRCCFCLAAAWGRALVCRRARVVNRNEDWLLMNGRIMSTVLTMAIGPQPHKDEDDAMIRVIVRVCVCRKHRAGEGRKLDGKPAISGNGLKTNSIH